MALMYPPLLGDAHGSRGERAVYEALARELPDDFYCYHSKELLVVGAGGAQEGEIDFVVVHAELGLLALEVKGGGLRRDGSGRWFRVGDWGEEPLRKDPFAQARKNLHHLVNLLEGRLPRVLPQWAGRLKLPYGHAVFLPEVELDAASVPSNMSEQVLLDAAALGELHARVREAMRVWSRSRVDVERHEFKKFRRHVLHPALKLVPSMASLFKLDEVALVRLTSAQEKLLDIAAELPRVQVKGGAGTGKTMLAIEKARRWAAEGKRVCLICYNRPLADAIKAALDVDASNTDDDPSAQIHVSTYHGLCALAARKLERPFDVPQAKEEQQAYWRSQAPDFLLDAVTAGLFTFDAVVVDEAQDLDTDWWMTVDALAGSSAPLWAFFDPDQDIYQRAGAMPKDLVPLSLSENCRSTRSLRCLCDEICGRKSQSPAFAPEGEAHVEIRYKSAGDLRRVLRDEIERLCGKEGLDASQLVVLSPHTQPNSSLAGVETVAGLKLVETPGEEGLLFSTARRYKGLEADVVLLIDQDPADPACTVAHRYVAASRAKHLLVVFTRAPWNTEN